MAVSGRQEATPSAGGPHLVLYDGSCGLCHGLVRFVLARDPAGLFHFASLQGAAAARHLAPFGGAPPRPTSVYVIANYQRQDPACRIKARAGLFIFRTLGWPWRMVSWLGVLPTVWLDWGYDLIARNRHRLLGGRESCLLPRAEHRDRFVDRQGDVDPRTEGAR